MNPLNRRDPSPRALPAAGIRFEANYERRVAALMHRVAAARQGREGAGGNSIRGLGEDLAGFRPYRPGEDLRQLDWNLLARLDRPFVRVTRRQAGESWTIGLDASASMGAGPPGKLQRAAECTGALVAIGLAQRAQVRVLVSAGAGSDPRVFTCRPRDERRGLLRFLEGVQAAGSRGLADILRTPRVLFPASRLFLIGDLFDVEAAALLPLRRGNSEVSVLRLLAPEELEPALGAREWWDPESGEHLRVDVGEAQRGEYERRLERGLERWRQIAAAHRVGLVCRSTAVEFEDLVREWLKAARMGTS